MKIAELFETTKNLDISITGNWKQRIFVTAKLKPSARTWVDINDEDVVKATYDITYGGKCLYRNHIISHKRGKGLAREVQEYIFAEAKKRGMTRTEGYIERYNFDAQSMAKKLGMKEIQQEKWGSLWRKEL